MKGLQITSYKWMEPHLGPPKVRVISLLQLSSSESSAMPNVLYQEMESVNASKNTKNVQNDVKLFSYFINVAMIHMHDFFCFLEPSLSGRSSIMVAVLPRGLAKTQSWIGFALKL